MCPTNKPWLTCISYIYWFLLFYRPPSPPSPFSEFRCFFSKSYIFIYPSIYSSIYFSVEGASGGDHSARSFAVAPEAPPEGSSASKDLRASSSREKEGRPPESSATADWPPGRVPVPEGGAAGEEFALEKEEADRSEGESSLFLFLFTLFFSPFLLAFFLHLPRLSLRISHHIFLSYSRVLPFILLCLRFHFSSLLLLLFHRPPRPVILTFSSSFPIHLILNIFFILLVLRWSHFGLIWFLSLYDHPLSLFLLLLLSLVSLFCLLSSFFSHHR